MLTRFAESYGDKMCVIAEYKDKYGETHGLYIAERYEKIIVAHNVVFDNNGNIKYWGNGEYGMIKGYSAGTIREIDSEKKWLIALNNTITQFLNEMEG